MAGFVVHERKEPFKGPCVLFMDYNGWWAPLTSLYYSTSSNVLVSRHPESAIEEIMSYYCPQCLDPYSETDAQLYRNKCTSCFQCPLCESPLAVVALDATTSCYQCRLCYWRSDGCNITGSDEQDIGSLVIEKERDDLTLESFQALYSSYLHEPTVASAAASSQQPQFDTTPLTGHHQLRYTWDDLNHKLNSALIKNNNSLDPRDESGLYSYMKVSNLFNQNMTDEDEETMLKTSSLSSLASLTHRLNRDHHGLSPLVDILPPKRTKLRTKKMVRCRKDVKENKMSILIQPKAFPLEGDSSHHLHQGKWWIKDSSAVHEIPHVTVLGTKNLVWSSLVSGGGGGGGGKCGFLHLSISNYKVNDILISLHESSLEHCLSTIHSPSLSPSFSPPLSPLSSSVSSSLTPQTNEPHQPFLFPCHTLHSSFTHSTTDPSASSSSSSSLHHLPLSAYEDELLRDEVDDKNLPDHAPEVEGQWTYSCQHNVLKVCLPLNLMNVSSSSSQESEKRKCGELFLTLICQDAPEGEEGDTGGEKVIRTSLRVVLPLEVSSF
jgi:hypothetical protein